MHKTVHRIRAPGTLTAFQFEWHNYYTQYNRASGNARIRPHLVWGSGGTNRSGEETRIFLLVYDFVCGHRLLEWLRLHVQL